MESLVSQGLDLAIFGMGTVFVFLTLLTLATHGMSLLVQKYDSQQTAFVPEVKPQQVNRQLLAVITAAIAQHRKKSK